MKGGLAWEGFIFMLCSCLWYKFLHLYINTYVEFKLQDIQSRYFQIQRQKGRLFDKNIYLYNLQAKLFQIFILLDLIGE